MCQYPWCKNTGVSRGTNRGGKVTCRNSKTARNLADVARRTVRLPRVVIVVPTPPRVAINGSNKGGNSRWQPRGVTTRVVIRGRRRTVRVVLAVYAVGFNPVV
jgi:hypothetical protein